MSTLCFHGRHLSFAEKPKKPTLLKGQIVIAPRGYMLKTGDGKVFSNLIGNHGFYPEGYFHEDTRFLESLVKLGLATAAEVRSYREKTRNLLAASRRRQDALSAHKLLARAGVVLTKTQRIALKKWEAQP